MREQTEQEKQQAYKKYLSSTQTGDAQAQYNLGWCYAEGQGVDKDDKKAVHYFQLAANQGHAQAQHNLGACYAKGQGVKKDEKKAVHYFQLAAEQGLAQAQYNLGWCYANGQGVDKDDKKAVHYYQLAANQGHARAQHNLGWCYVKGQGVKKDEKKAVHYFQLAAEQGYANAQNSLGWYHETGMERNAKEAAVRNYQLAAMQKHSYGQANLGRCYQYGIGVKKDTSKAFEQYRAATDQNEPYGQTFLGWCYEWGIGVEQDAKVAVSLYQKAAEKGFALAQSNLSRCYQKGIGVKTNKNEAARWADQAARRVEVHFHADFFALCYEQGWGVEQNLSQAQVWRKYLQEKNPVSSSSLLAVAPLSSSTQHQLMDIPALEPVIPPMPIDDLTEKVLKIKKEKTARKRKAYQNAPKLLHPITPEEWKTHIKTIRTTQDGHLSTASKNCDPLTSTLAEGTVNGIFSSAPTRTTKEIQFNFEASTIERTYKDKEGRQQRYLALVDAFTFYQGKGLHRWLEPPHKTLINLTYNSDVFKEEIHITADIEGFAPIIISRLELQDQLRKLAVENGGWVLIGMGFSRLLPLSSEDKDISLAKQQLFKKPGHLCSVYVVTPEFNESHGNILKENDEASQLITFLEPQALSRGTREEYVAHRLEELFTIVSDGVEKIDDNIFDNHFSLLILNSHNKMEARAKSKRIKEEEKTRSLASQQLPSYEALLHATVSWGEGAEQEIFRRSRLETKEKDDKEKKLTAAELLKRAAATFGYDCENMHKDGNCFYHAVSHQLQQQLGVLIPHDKLRAEAVQHMLTNLNLYKSSIDQPLDTFIDQMSRPGEWADGVHVAALSHALNITVVIVRSDGEQPTIYRRFASNATVYLGYEVGMHYQSLIKKEPKLNGVLGKQVRITHFDTSYPTCISLDDLKKLGTPAPITSAVPLINTPRVPSLKDNKSKDAPDSSAQIMTASLTNPLVSAVKKTSVMISTSTHEEKKEKKAETRSLPSVATTTASRFLSNPKSIRYKSRIQDETILRPGKALVCFLIPRDSKSSPQLCIETVSPKSQYTGHVHTLTYQNAEFHHSIRGISPSDAIPDFKITHEMEANPMDIENVQQIQTQLARLEGKSLTDDLLKGDGSVDWEAWCDRLMMPYDGSEISTHLAGNFLC